MLAEWFCRISGDDLGPLSSGELKAMAADGRLRPEDYLRKGTEGPWLLAAGIKGLFPAEGSAPGASGPTRLPVAKPLKDPGADPPPRPRPASLPAARPAAPPAVRRRSQRRSASELPAAQPSPKVPPIPAATGPGGSAGAEPERFDIVTDADTPAARTAGRTTGGPAGRRSRRRRNTIVIGSLVMLVIGLAVAGVVLAVANRDFGESAKRANEATSGAPTDDGEILAGTEDPAPDSPQRRGAGASGPSDEPGDPQWLDASKSAIRREDVGVRISSAKIVGPREIQEVLGLSGRPRRTYLLVVVDVENLSGDRQLEYTRWGSGSSISRRVRLSDNLDKTYRMTRFVEAGARGPSTSAPIGPSERIEDLLVFQRPAEGVEFLRLELPAAALGMQGTLRFKIPREMIAVGEEEPGPQDPARPPGEGVPEIDRGIAELEAQGKQGGRGAAKDPNGGVPGSKKPGEPAEGPDDEPDIFKDYPELRGDGPADDGDSGFRGKVDDSRPAPGQKDG